MELPGDFPEVKLSAEGERMLQEGLDDIAAGRVRSYDTVEDLIADLHRYCRARDVTRRARGRGRMRCDRPADWHAHRPGHGRLRYGSAPAIASHTAGG